MITADDITAANRRERVRSLADVSTISYDDDKINPVIENADAIAISLFNADSGLPTGNGLIRLITVSNLITSTLIRSGIGGEENNTAIKTQTKQYCDIVEAHNQRSKKQHAHTTISNNITGGTFFSEGIINE